MRGWSGWLVVSPVRRNLPLLAFTLLALLSCPQNIRAQDVLVMPKSGEANAAVNRDSDVFILPNANTVMPVAATVPVTAGAVLAPAVHEDHVEYRARDKANVFAPPLTTRQPTVALINIPEPAKPTYGDVNLVKRNIQSTQVTAIPQNSGEETQSEAVTSTPKLRPSALSLPTRSGLERPMTPMGLTSEKEDNDLALAVEKYRSNMLQNVKFPKSHDPLNDYLLIHPKSPWRFAILAQINEDARQEK